MAKTDNMHKSTDGVWRPCEAKGDCPLGHATTRDVTYAGQALARIGFGKQSVKTLDSKTIKSLADKERAYTNANTPAWALASEDQLPPVGAVKTMPRQNGTFQSALWKSAGVFVRENQVQGEVEVLSEERKTVSGSSSTPKIKTVKATLQYEDKNTPGNQKKLEFEYEEESYENTVSPNAAIVKYFVQSAAYQRSLGTASEEEAVASLAKRSRVSEVSARKRLQAEKVKYETLRDFIGQNTMNAMAAK
jgi:hypothetical protein